MKCNRENCEKDAVKKVRLLFYAPSDKLKEKPVEAIFNLFVCSDHAIPDPALYVTDEGWKTIEKTFKEQGLIIPDRNTIEVTFLDLN